MSQVQTNQRETRFQDERNQEMQKVAVQIDDIHAIQTELNPGSAFSAPIAPISATVVDFLAGRKIEK